MRVACPCCGETLEIVVQSAAPVAADASNGRPKTEPAPDRDLMAEVLELVRDHDGLSGNGIAALLAQRPALPGRLRSGRSKQDVLAACRALAAIEWIQRDGKRWIVAEPTTPTTRPTEDVAPAPSQAHYAAPSRPRSPGMAAIYGEVD